MSLAAGAGTGAGGARPRKKSTPPSGKPSGPTREEREAIRRAFLVMALAHEIKQPLHSLNLNVELLSKRIGRSGGNADVAGPLEALSRVVDRINGCIESVSGRLVPDPVDPRPRDLREHVDLAVLRLSTEARRAGVRLTVDIAKDVPPLPLNPSQIAVALDALLRNAVQACRKGGQVAIRAVRDPEEVRLEISDDGEGMPPEVLRHAVEIGFSTRGLDGTGMTVAKFVAYHHLGGFHVESRPGSGTTVSMTLPLVAEPDDDAA